MAKFTHLSEGITHIEDLPLADFIKAVRNIKNMVATEKLDGSNLWFGLDDGGRFYTTRAGKTKNAVKMYDESDYPYLASSNPFRAAHAALQEKLDDVKRIVQPGQTVEIEVLFGRQPNAITYGLDGKNYIAFLRGVQGTPDVVADQLSTALGNTAVNVNVGIVDSSDGENLSVNPTDLTFQFTATQHIPTEKLKDLNVDSKIQDLEDFLNQESELEGVTNFDILTRSLGSFDTDIRPEAKRLKADVMTKVSSEFKLPIKQELLRDFVQKIKPALAAHDVLHDEDIGIEGVVLRDPASGEQIKIVDKDNFTTINQFNHSMRYKINGPVKTLDRDAPMESRGGVVGDLKIHIADLLGNPDMARGAPLKKILADMHGDSPTDTIKKLATTLNVEDFQGVKRKIVALTNATIAKLAGMLQDFKDHKDDYHLRLKSGKTMGLSPEIVKRTYLSFAEAKRDLTDLRDKIKGAKKLEQALAILYGKAAKNLDAAPKEEAKEETVSESVLQEKRYDNDKARYSNKDAWTLLNIYLATLFSAVTVYQAMDKQGIRQLRDKTHYRLAGWSREMSPLNFWGYAIWKASSPAVKKMIGVKTAQAIFKITRRVPRNFILNLHMDLSYGHEAPIEWADHLKTVRTLQQFEGLNIERINTLVHGAFNYSTLTFDEKVKFITKLYFYVQQFVPTSPLLLRIKAIQDKLLLNANDQNTELVTEMKLLSELDNLAEEGEALPASATVVATTTSNIASVEGGGKGSGGRQIMRIRRNPDVKRKKFQKPDDTTV